MFVKRVILLIAVLIVAGIFLLLYLSKNAPMVPTNYQNSVETGGKIESTYLKMGTHEVSHSEGFFPTGSPKAWGNYVIYYPKDLEQSSRKYPVVVSANGTGVPASHYTAMFEHLASWGFIVLGNEDPETATGASVDATLSALLKEDKNPESVFFEKVDTDNIGIFGHSQGGVSTFNAISIQEHKNIYQTAVSLSPSDEENSRAQGRPYDPSKVSIPILVLAGSGVDAISLKNMQLMYQKIEAPRLFARKVGMNHGEMLYSADGYVTAWFMWRLQDDENAAKAFTGDSPEIFNNKLYQDQQSNLEKER